MSTLDLMPSSPTVSSLDRPLAILPLLKRGHREARVTLQLALVFNHPLEGIIDHVFGVFSAAETDCRLLLQIAHPGTTPDNIRQQRSPFRRQQGELVQHALEAVQLRERWDDTEGEAQEAELEAVLHVVSTVLAVAVVLAVELLDGVGELLDGGLGLAGRGGVAAELLAKSEHVVVARFHDEGVQLGDLEEVGNVLQAHLGDEVVVLVLVEVRGDVHT